MINYNDLSIGRMIMHRILSKVTRLRDASTELSDELVALDDDIKSVIKERLLNSFAKASKAFELKIESDAEGSCFSLIKGVSMEDDSTFISISKDIANMLAESQGNKQIPGGYLLILDCRQQNGHPVIVIIKAESHSALNIRDNSTEALKNIILSPSQKMYKAAIFERVGNSVLLSKDDYEVWLFDNQFDNGSSLASYFYKDFLGLTATENAKIQTKRFYELTDKMIDKVFVNDAELASDCKAGLQVCLSNNSRTINPHEVINSIIPLMHRDLFNNSIVNIMPHSFLKDTALLTERIRHKSIFLMDGVKLYAPTMSFDNRTVEILSDPDDPSIKIVKVRTNGGQAEN